MSAIAVAYLFSGMSVLVVLSMVAYAMYQLIRFFRAVAGKEEKHALLECAVLEKIATEKGINLEEEKVKQEMQLTSKFRKKVEQEMLKRLFTDKKE